MAEEHNGVTPAGSQPAPVTPPVTTVPPEQVPSTDAAVVAENLKKAMQSEREQRKEAERLVAEKDAEIARLKASTTPPATPPASDPALSARVEVLTLVQKDAFVKDNLGLIEEIMLANPALDVKAAVDKAKASIFDELQKAKGQTPPPNVPPKTITPGATPEHPAPTSSGSKLQDVADGKVNVPPEMRAAINQVRR